MAALEGEAQPAPHYQDVFAHTCSVMAHLDGIAALIWSCPDAEASGADFPWAAPWVWSRVEEMLAPYATLLRAHLGQPLTTGRTRQDWLPWAALLHDTGKPATRSGSAEPPTFPGHEAAGALLAAARLQRLRAAKAEVDAVATTVRGHMRPAAMARAHPASRTAIYRYYREMGPSGVECALLSLADHLSLHAQATDPERLASRLATTDLLLEAYFLRRETWLDPPPILDGRQVMEISGLGPGPELGSLLAQLRERQAIGEIRSTEAAVWWLAEQAGGGPPERGAPA